VVSIGRNVPEAQADDRDGVGGFPFWNGTDGARAVGGNGGVIFFPRSRFRWLWWDGACGRGRPRSVRGGTPSDGRSAGVSGGSPAEAWGHPTGSFSPNAHTFDHVAATDPAVRGGRGGRREQRLEAAATLEAGLAAGVGRAPCGKDVLGRTERGCIRRITRRGVGTSVGIVFSTRARLRPRCCD